MYVTVKISRYIYLHYEIVLLIIWVQYRSFNNRSTLHRVSGKVLTFRTCPQKLYFETLWQPDYQYSWLFCKKCLSAKLSFTINTHSNKRPLKKLTKIINARGLYLEYYIWNLQDCNSFILLWPLRTSQTANDICSNYVVKFAKWICNKRADLQKLLLHMTFDVPHG